MPTPNLSQYPLEEFLNLPGYLFCAIFLYYLQKLPPHTKSLRNSRLCTERNERAIVLSTTKL